MRTTLVVLVVLLLAAVGADRVAERIAVDRAESRLVAEGVTDPKVDIGGFPFLTQLLQRSFDDVTMTAPALSTSSGKAQDLDVVAQGVDLPQGGQATIGSVRGSGLVTYDEVMQRSGTHGLTLSSAGGGQVRLRGSATVLGQSLPVSALGKVQAAGRSVRIVPTGFEVAGRTIDSGGIVSALASRFTVTYRLRGLPRGLRVQSVEPRATGFEVVVAGQDVTVKTGG